MEEDDVFRLPAVLDRDGAAAALAEIRVRLDRSGEPLVLDAGAVEETDTAGAAVLVAAWRLAEERGRRLHLRGVGDALRERLELLRVDRVLGEEPEPSPRESLVARIGGWWLRTVDKGIRQCALHVEALVLTFTGPFRKRGPRLGHFLHQLDVIGVGGVGIVALISLLIGLIMALQAAVQLRQFGANIYVANMVGVSMTRELGPLVTAIILSARSGSAITAELGTMVVTEEVDALRVMDVDPRAYLVAPRFAALLVALPCLALLADVAGIAGGFGVGTLGLDIGFVHYWNQTLRAVLARDVLTGLAKAFVFANVIGIVCCHEGLALRGGPEEVGRATTRAVVASIILVIAADLLFTVFFFALE